jgi:hypothetical protein
MKNIILSLIITFIALGFTGCGSPRFLDGVSPQGKDFNSAISKENSQVKIMTTVENDNIKKKLPILIKAAAKEFEKQNIEYFTVSSLLMNGPFGVESGMNNNITNAKDMLDYCYPKAFGLEIKCEKLEKAKYSFFTLIPKTKSFDKPQWSVKEVLEDSFYDIESEELIFKELTAIEAIKAIK